MSRVSVLGAGSFGTALAQALLDAGQQVTMWCRDGAAAERFDATKRNPKYLKDFELPGLRVVASLPDAVQGADLVVLVAPSHATAALAQALRPLLPAVPLVCATKGIEEGSHRTMAELLADELPEHRDSLAFLSGPSFAREMMLRHPTAVVVASRQPAVAEAAQRAFATPWFRVYTSADVVGVELGGSVKNVVAIAAGLADGLGFGANAGAAIITRGLAEMSRLGVALGGDPLTFMGLAGVGDLVLTCTGELSRNRTVGKRLASGMSLDEVTASLGGQVAEGVRTTVATRALAREAGLEMPIVDAVYAILHEGAEPAAMVARLMGRPLKRERD